MNTPHSKFRIALVIVLMLALTACNQSREPLKLPPKEFETKLSILKNIQLVDVRTPEEYQLSHLKNAININFLDIEFKKQISQLDKRRPIFIYCAAGVEGGRSNKTCKILNELEFNEIYELEGGITNWTNAGKETVK